MTKKRIVIVVLGLVLTGLLSCSEAPPERLLRVLTWPGYADADIVAQFEKRFGARVVVEFINSDEELWLKLNLNQGADFDVFAVNTAELSRYIDAGISIPVDLANIPNAKHQLPRFQDRDAIPGLMRDGNLYAIPYTYSTMGLIYNKQLVKEVPDSMTAMLDPRYKGQVLAYDGAIHNFSVAALMLGFSNPFELNDPQFKLATAKLIELRKNILSLYTAPEQVVELYRQHPVALIFGNYGTQQVRQLQDAGADIGYVIPREGVLAWLDCWAVTRGARDHNLAEAWINFMLETDISNALTQRQDLANTVSATDVTADSDQIIWLQPVANYASRTRIWNEIRQGVSSEIH